MIGLSLVVITDSYKKNVSKLLRLVGPGNLKEADMWYPTPDFTEYAVKETMASSLPLSRGWWILPVIIVADIVVLSFAVYGIIRFFKG